MDYLTAEGGTGESLVPAAVTLTSDDPLAIFLAQEGGGDPGVVAVQTGEATLGNSPTGGEGTVRSSADVLRDRAIGIDSPVVTEPITFGGLADVLRQSARSAADVLRSGTELYQAVRGTPRPAAAPAASRTTWLWLGLGAAALFAFGGRR